VGARGGTLVTMGGATAWAARDNVNLTSARVVGADSGAAAAAKAAAADTAAPAGGDLLAVTSPGASPDAPAPVPGAMFDAVLDQTHWLTFGMPAPRVTALVEGNGFLRLSKQGTNVAVFPRAGAFYRPASRGRGTPNGCSATRPWSSRSRSGAATWCCSRTCPPSAAGCATWTAWCSTRSCSGRASEARRPGAR
jgi:hypothetical protein